jgi:hypothetical protein
VQGGSIGDEVIRRQIAAATEIQATRHVDTSELSYEDFSSVVDVSPLIGEVSFTNDSLNTSPSPSYDSTTPSLSSDVLTSSSSQRDDDATTTTWIDPSNAIDWNAVVFDEEMEALWRDSQGVAMKLFDVVG